MSKLNININKLQENIAQYINGNKEELLNIFPSFVAEIRQNAMKKFIKNGFPTQKDEKWRKTKLKDFTAQYFHTGMSKLFNPKLSWDACIVPKSNIQVLLINGIFASESAVNHYDNGIIVGSLRVAMQHYPDLIEKYFNQLISKKENNINNLNTALFIDGLFVYIPKNIKSFKLQLTNRFDAKIDTLINMRNLIIVEENAQFDLIQCDDSNQHKSHFTTVNTEVFVGDNAEMNWYKYQNINNVSAIISQHYYQVESNARLYTNFMELNGKLLRNEQFADIVGSHAKVDLLGLYLVDKQQQTDNVIFVSHSAAGSYSNQKFKGILDDTARGFFNGQILVKQQAQQTNAFQKNNNILLTDKARISSQPFLEIYADDVSCSHGSTTGQIDEEALFYIRQRGISKRDAQLLQLYAFVGEIIDAIKIPELIEPTKDLIKKRLNGELETCEDCILQCAEK
jgi:Fe-S cluster assembly protein SufD